MKDSDTAGDAMEREDPLAAPQPVPTTSGRKAPVPKRKRPGPYRVPPREHRNGLLIVNTGDGKGKTTAAIGLLLRAAGRKMTVGMYQFMKSDAVLGYGEQVAARRLGIEITPLGGGCTPGVEDMASDQELAVAGWNRCRAAVVSGEFDMLILDELTLPLDFGWLDTETVIADIRSRPVGTHVVITGRRAPAALIEAADLVTEMRMIKHPLREKRVRAQAGIDV
ncbi:MAG: cob(I)yrinic acid a,c-diamide adenosyltransferase [bacterium]